MIWSTMMISMMLAGIASQYWTRGPSARSRAAQFDHRDILGWANVTGRLPEPPREGVEPKEIEVHGERTSRVAEKTNGHR